MHNGNSSARYNQLHIQSYWAEIILWRHITFSCCVLCSVSLEKLRHVRCSVVKISSLYLYRKVVHAEMSKMEVCREMINVNRSYTNIKHRIIKTLKVFISARYNSVSGGIYEHSSWLDKISRHNVWHVSTDVGLQSGPKIHYQLSKIRIKSPVDENRCVVTLKY